jgi:hypothetical protein
MSDAEARPAGRRGLRLGCLLGVVLLIALMTGAVLYINQYSPSAAHRHAKDDARTSAQRLADYLRTWPAQPPLTDQYLQESVRSHGANLLGANRGPDRLDLTVLILGYGPTLFGMDEEMLCFSFSVPIPVIAHGVTYRELATCPP